MRYSKSTYKSIRLLILSLVVFSQACVGKFLSTMLSNEGANFKLIEATPVSNTRIRVSFNKPLDQTKGDATKLSNYSIPGLNLISVAAGSETHQVFLNLDPADSVRMQKISYTLTVSNILNQTLDPLLADGRSLTFTGARWLRAVCQNDDGTSSCPPLAATGGATVYSVKVRGDYAAGSNYRWELVTVAYIDHDANPATPLQRTETPFSTYNFTANGITPVATPISITGLTTNNFSLKMQIQDAAGAWQPASDYSFYEFFVDSTSPAKIGLAGAAGPSATPAYTTLTNVRFTNINVRPRSCTEFPLPAPDCYASPEAPSHYKYQVLYQAGTCPSASPAVIVPWTAEISANQPINYDMNAAQGCYTIRVLVRDQAGNWQCNTGANDNLASQCELGLGTGSVNSFFNNRSYQMAHYQFDTTEPVASFNSGTLPNNPTAATSITTAVVASADVPYFRYRISGPGQAGVWSNDKVSGLGGVANPFITGTPPGEFISVSGLSNGGTYIIDIIGKDPAGNYQSTASPTTYTFVVNTSVPTAVLTAYTGAGGCVGMQGLPNNPTNNNCFSVTVGGPGVTHYKALLVTGSSCSNIEADYPAVASAVGTNFINTSPGFINGTTYSLCVRGGGALAGPFGLSAGEITRHTFTYDSAPPTGTAVTQLLTPTYTTAPASATIKTVLKDADVIIGNSSGEAVLAYKGAIYQTTDCSVSPGLAAIQALTEKSVYTPIQKTGMANAEQRVCFIGRDAAGNYQTSVQQYSFTVFDPSTPADGGGVNDSAYVSNFNYTWTGIPADVTEIRIRVCTDSSCASPIPGFQNGLAVCSSAATCAATTSYNVVSNCTGLGCIKALNGSSYYAQLRVTDAAGNLSSFGTISNGKIISGGVTGLIRDTNGNPVNGATVTLYNSTCTGVAYGTIASAADGTFTISNSPVGAYPPIILAANGHCIKVSASGSRQGTKQFIGMDPAANTNVGSIYVVDPTGNGCIIGALVDGSTGSQLTLSNATFTLKDWNGNTISGAPALDPDGKQFVFPASCVASTAAWGNSPYATPLFNYGCLNPKNTNAPTCNDNARPALDNSQANGPATTALSSGVYSLQVSVPNYYNFTEPSIGVTANATPHTGYLPMVGTFAAGSDQIKVILTWGTGAKDLDFHVVGSTTGTDCVRYNEGNGTSTGILDALKFHVYFQQKYCADGGTAAPVGSTQLAVDDTYEYGPEIINFYTGYANSGPAIYKFSVYNNDAVAPNWTNSKARVYVYAGNYFTGGGGLIKTIDVHTSSTNRLWKPFKMSISGTTLTVDDSGGATYGYAAATYAQVVGVSDGLTAGAAVNGVSPADPNTDPGLFSNGLSGAAGPLDW